MSAIQDGVTYDLDKRDDLVMALTHSPCIFIISLKLSYYFPVVHVVVGKVYYSKLWDHLGKRE